MLQTYTPEFRKKIVRLHEEEGRTYNGISFRRDSLIDLQDKKSDSGKINVRSLDSSAKPSELGQRELIPHEVHNNTCMKLPQFTE